MALVVMETAMRGGDAMLLWLPVAYIRHPHHPHETSSHLQHQHNTLASTSINADISNSISRPQLNSQYTFRCGLLRSLHHYTFNTFYSLPMASGTPLKVGYVPEHFSTPLHFAQKHFGLEAQLIAFPSGTGHMITSLRSGEIDVGIGLTEGWVAGLGASGVEGDGGYKIVGTYVETPLCTDPFSFFIATIELGAKNAQAGRYQLAQSAPCGPLEI